MGLERGFLVGFWWDYSGGLFWGCVVEAAMYSGHFRGVSAGFYMPLNYNLIEFIDFFIDCGIMSTSQTARRKAEWLANLWWCCRPQYTSEGSDFYKELDCKYIVTAKQVNLLGAYL